MNLLLLAQLAIQTVCLVETWFSVDILDNEVFISNYLVVRLDRNRYGGGVLVYVHSSITYNVLLLCGHANLELIVVSLLRNSFKLCLFSIDSHPPNFLFLIPFVMLYFL